MAITLFDTQSQKPVNFNTGSEAKDALLSGSVNFDPNQEVYLKDIEGNIKKAKGSDAASYVLSPGSGYDIASDEDIYLKNREARYGTPVQQGVAAVEGLANSAGLGFGNALTKVAIGLATPGDKENKLAEQYGEAVQQRSAENPVANIAGEVGGLVLDPFGLVGEVSKGTRALGKGAAKATTLAAESPLTPNIINKVINNPLASKMIERGVEFGAEGAVYGAAFEAGRQMVDSNPINADAIIDSAGTGLATGLTLGPVFGAAEQATAKTLKVVKSQAKKYLDKITGATGEAKGEIFHSVSPYSLEKEAQPAYGRSQKAIKFSEEADGTLKYQDGRKQGIIDLPQSSNGLDLTDPAAVESLGSKFGIDNLEDKAKYLKNPEEPLTEFLARQKKDQLVENSLRDIQPYMEAADSQALDRIKQVRDNFNKLQDVTENDIGILKQAATQEEKLFNKYNPDKTINSPESLKRNLEDAKKTLSEFDYIKDFGEEGQKKVFVYNEGILPSELTVKNLGKGITPIDYEAGQMAKQYRMTPSKMQKMGNARLNEVADFIFDQYPKQGSILKKATTSVDHIAEQINEVKNRAINDINDSIEQALNLERPGTALTTQDIANHIEKDILKRYTDPISGNPSSGVERAYSQIKEFAEGYRNNGYTTDGIRYGIKEYQPLNVKEIRELRLKLDDVANFGKKEGTVLEEEARNLRTWVEDKVMSRVGNVDADLLEKYKKAKKNYGLSIDASKIVDAAAQKAAKDNKFSLFYSGVGAGVGSSIAGTPGAVIGGVMGGAASNIMREYSGNLSVFMARDLAKNAQRYENIIQNTAKSFFKAAEGTVKTYVRAPTPGEGEIARRDYDRLYGEIADREKYVENFMDKNEFLFEQYPETGERLVQTATRAREFLLSKIPVNPYLGNPWKEETWQPSPYEVDKYMRYREAVNKPSLILDQIKNSYVTPEAAEVLNLVYPETKQSLLNQFLQQAAKAKHIPVAKRVEIFKLFGIELDSFMSGSEFNELQGQSNQQAIDTATGGPIQKPNNAYKNPEPELTQGQSTAKMIQ